MTYLIIFMEFFKTGLFAIGGGFATLPFLYRMTENYDWFTAEQLADMIAVSEITPGPLGVTMAAYAGFNAGGPLFAALSTTALVLPSIIVITIVASFLNKFSENKYVVSVFTMLRPAVPALIAAAFYQVFKISVTGVKTFLIFAVIFILMRKYNKHPLLYIGGAAVLGIILRI